MILDLKFDVLVRKSDAESLYCLKTFTSFDSALTFADALLALRLYTEICVVRREFSKVYSFRIDEKYSDYE